MRFLAAIVVVAAIAPLAWPCWSSIDPHGFAQECPIVVAGSIESVAEAKPGGERSDDIASIRIETIHRNELKDRGLAVGDLLDVRMISKNNRLRTSTDLNYPAKTKAVWLIVLTSKGELRIDRHPVQKQPLKFAPNFGKGERKAGLPKGRDDNLKNPAGSKTTAEWIAWTNDKEVQHAKELAAHQAQQKAIRDLAKLFAEPDGLNDKVWKRFQDADVDVRRGILQLSIHEQPMSGTRFAEVAQGTLLREKDDNVRTHAVSQLAYCRDPGAKGMEVLAAALRDKSATVRMFACQSVKMRRYEQLADQVRQLRNDPDPAVREMAADTLAFWQEKSKK